MNCIIKFLKSQETRPWGECMAFPAKAEDVLRRTVILIKCLSWSIESSVINPLGTHLTLEPSISLVVIDWKFERHKRPIKSLDRLGLFWSMQQSVAESRGGHVASCRWAGRVEKIAGLIEGYYVKDAWSSHQSIHKTHWSRILNVYRHLQTEECVGGKCNGLFNGKEQSMPTSGNKHRLGI